MLNILLSSAIFFLLLLEPTMASFRQNVLNGVKAGEAVLSKKVEQITGRERSTAETAARAVLASHPVTVGGVVANDIGEVAFTEYGKYLQDVSNKAKQGDKRSQTLLDILFTDPESGINYNPSKYKPSQNPQWIVHYHNQYGNNMYGPALKS